MTSFRWHINRQHTAWGTMIKPNTSYFLFLITFRHNRICGLAVAFKKYFLGGLPALPKKSRNRGVLGELRQTSRNANNVIRPPPPRSPSASDDSPCIYSLVANQAMQSHGDNTSACDCIARFSPWGDFHIKIVLTTHARGHDITFLSVATRKWPSPLPNLVNTPPLHARVPSPNIRRRRVTPVSQGGVRVSVQDS